MSIWTGKKTRAAEDALSELIGAESVIARERIRTGTMAEFVSNKALAAVTPATLDLVQLFDGRTAWKKILSINEISWIDPDPRGPNYPLVLRNTDLDRPLWLAPLKIPSKLSKALLTTCWTMPGADLTVRLDGVDIAVEFRPTRAGIPGGWHARSPDGEPHVSDAIALAKKAWRNQAIRTDSRIVTATAVNVPLEVPEDLAGECLLRHLIGFKKSWYTWAVSRDQGRYVIALTEDKQLAAIEYRSIQQEAVTEPWSSIASIDDVDTRAGAHSFDGQFIYLAFPRDTKVLRIDVTSPDKHWSRVIGKAVSSPAPMFSF